MSAVILSRDSEVNEKAFAKVREDRTREETDGFDGSWVAHPGMVEVCRKVFIVVLGDQPNQLEKTRPDVNVNATQLLDITSTGGQVTEADCGATSVSEFSISSPGLVDPEQ